MSTTELLLSCRLAGMKIAWLWVVLTAGLEVEVIDWDWKFWLTTGGGTTVLPCGGNGAGILINSELAELARR